jgi:hypothetical protein
MLRKFFSRLVSISLLTIFGFQIAKAAVELVEFTATPLSDSILIEWETATEFNNAGFFVTRRTNPNDPYEPISDFIPAEGSGPIGAEYEYLDEDVSVGILYYYVLEDVDTSNLVETHGPVTAMIEDSGSTSTPTPSATPTASSTSTFTPSPESSRTATHTPTSTRTPVPTRTFTPAPPTLTPTPYTHTPTITATPTITPTTTLENPPVLILTLPASSTPSPTETQNTHQSITVTSEPDGIFSQLSNSSYPLTMGAICLVALIWAAFAVGIFILIQYRNS